MVMPDRLPEGGPYRRVPVDGSATAPFYVIPFDNDGVCTGPLTQANLLEEVRRSGPTDLFVFSHGWNNDWSAAIGGYDRFIDGLRALRAQHPLQREYLPVLVGVFWPSVALVAPWERGPGIAAEGVGDDCAVAEERAEIEEVAAVVPADRRPRFYELAQRSDGLSGADAAEFAALLSPAFSGSDELRTVESTPADDVLEIWTAAGRGAAARTTDDFGFATGEGGGPQSAGIFDKLDPRNLIRMATVLLMKDRAGRVGARGVADLLEALLAEGDARVHLVGHSYGGKVVLSALAAKSHSREVDSVLLLQPAMSHLCFAANVNGEGFPGGYRVDLDRSRQPIMATFSKHDFPLTKVFHLAVRRRSDLGEAQIAGAPSPYAALGGFGPDGVAEESVVIKALAPPQAYPTFAKEVRVVAVESSDVIGGHGDIANDATFWMLLNQLASP